MSECGIKNCDGSVAARGWCWSHYHAWRMYGDPLKRKPRGRFSEYDTDVCLVPGCDTEHRSNGLCSAHYERTRRFGIESSPEGIREYEMNEAFATLTRYGYWSNETGEVER